MTTSIEPTREQANIIECETEAFISACPGAGKTRTMVERACRKLADRTLRKGIAFLSFTNAAVSELDRRLRAEGVLPAPSFPHFLGTFDGFLWQFFIAPFGIPGSQIQPRLIPDKDSLHVKPFQNARVLPLRCFDRTTGTVVDAVAARLGVKPQTVQPAYVTAARNTWSRLRQQGHLDFADVREIVSGRLADPVFASRLGTGLSNRFAEVIVDEAQDCNPADLRIIQWLRDSQIPTKVICDPHQSIYGFRGGVTDELVAFAETYQPQTRLPMTGNFRASPAICKAIAALRPGACPVVDTALGPHRELTTPIHIIAYAGKGVPPTLGETFRKLTAEFSLPTNQCPVLAATNDTAAKATGLPGDTDSNHLTLQIASAVTAFHCAADGIARKAALEEFHRALIRVQGNADGKSYHQHLADNAIAAEQWRPKCLSLMHALGFFPSQFAAAADWLIKARTLLAPHMPTGGTTSVAQLIKSHADLASTLHAPATSQSPARSIHSVKGLEFPAVCVVMTTSSAKGILSYLQSGAPVAHAEEARKIYVAASRAEKLLVIAVPKSRSKQLIDRLSVTDTPIAVCEV